MKILILSPLDPIPINSGLRERIYQTCRHLGERHNVRLIYPFEPTRASLDGRVPDSQPFECINLKHPLLSWLDRRVPHYSALRGLYKTHPWLYPAVRQQITTFDPDTVLVEMPFLVPVALVANRRKDTPIALTEHNIQYKITNRLDIRGTKALRAFESEVANRVDVVFTVSETDRQTLSQHVSSSELVVAPNGVDVDRFRPSQEQLKLQLDLGSPVFVYHGSLGNAQNSEAVEILVNRIFPALRDEFPEAQLVLIGSNPPDVDQRGVLTTGLVDDLPAYIAMADVAVVPLQSGSGTKLKILEYMASGVPVVTTPIGAEGLPIEHGRHAVIEEEWDPFINQTIRAVRDEAWAASMAEESRKLVESKFSWQATLDVYSDVLEKQASPETETTNRNV